MELMPLKVKLASPRGWATRGTKKVKFRLRLNGQIGGGVGHMHVRPVKNLPFESQASRPRKNRIQSALTARVKSQIGAAPPKS